jgi:hypothetical protein
MVPNRRSAPALLRLQSSRESKRALKRTLANLTGLPSPYTSNAHATRAKSSTPFAATLSLRVLPPDPPSRCHPPQASFEIIQNRLIR